MINPEFNRNLWLEFSKHRLIAMPAIIAAILFLASFADDAAGAMAGAAATIFYMLTFLWGGHLAAGAVIDELNDNSWDFQRMSSMTAWQMAWGKLFGSTSYVWYGALIALVAYIFNAPFSTDADNMGHNLLLMVGTGLLCQAVALLSSVESLSKIRTQQKKIRTIGHHIFGLIVGWGFLQAGQISSWQKNPTIEWYGDEYGQYGFVIVSLAVFMFWTLLGIYRMMRRELMFRTTPLVWGGFVVFLMMYFAGFVNTPEWVTKSSSFCRNFEDCVEDFADFRAMLAFFIGAACLYWAIFSEQKDFVAYRKWFTELRKGNISKVLENTPRWLVSFDLFVLAGIFAIIFTPKMPEGVYISSIVATTILFAIRDIGIIHLLNMSPRRKRADLAAVLYLAVLYFLIPAILQAMDMSYDMLFVPGWDEPLYLAILPSLAQVLVVFVLLKRSWNRMKPAGV